MASSRAERSGFLVRESIQTVNVSKGDSTARFYLKGDIATIVLSALQPSGQLFMRPDEQLVATNQNMVVTEGTRIAWAGYSQFVEEISGRPELCYFEGAVSKCVIHKDRTVYVVDGHCHPGVSGGPVWACPHEDNCPQLIGIVSEYGAVTDKNHDRYGLHGLCCFELLNPLVAYWASANQ